MNPAEPFKNSAAGFDNYISEKVRTFVYASILEVKLGFQ